MARRMPISRVRSVTETSMMFMMPMPAAMSAMELTTVTPMRTERVKLLNCSISESFEDISKSSSWSGGTLRMVRNAARTSAMVLIAQLARSRACTRMFKAAGEPAAIAVKTGGERDDSQKLSWSPPEEPPLAARTPTTV